MVRRTSSLEPLFNGYLLGQRDMIGFSTIGIQQIQKELYIQRPRKVNLNTVIPIRFLFFTKDLEIIMLSSGYCDQNSEVVPK